MNISPVGNTPNYKSQPQFGMALKIDPKAGEALSKKSSAYLNRLAKIGKDMKEYKHIDILINENGNPIVKYKHNAGAYSNIEPAPRPFDAWIKIKTNWQGENVYTNVSKGDVMYQDLNLASEKDALKFYNELTKSNADELSRAEAYAKVLENLKEAARFKKEDLINAYNKKTEEVKNLLSEFGEVM